MHSHAEVWIPDNGNADKIKQYVSIAMQPYHEEAGGWWDWWQVGGRWTGCKDGYNPEKDPSNIQTCEYCHGTGKRTDIIVTNGCNACKGTGKRVVWPTQWRFHKGDICHVNDVPDNLQCSTLLLAETKPIMAGKEDSTVSVKEELKRLEVTNGYLVTVDYHD